MTKVLKQWPLDKRIPKGWKIAKQNVSHHSRYSILIEKKTKVNKNK